ncbi:hypothetical protein E6W36_11875 [Hankyongella ginsenosidimutans]|uniref:Uncharacterized protein n=1 Tax=Hankyongella ginsenosidimutans TaxID=1763828 RepID=A0A4D7CA06_9SPHN|nr:hypothetical protein [Hankyongella ginsenosidimutans]QCI79957.1 hypothetical protein E6W36_11875 [Hankyongella ginsenosidimutans]
MIVAPIADGFAARADERAQLALTYTQNERLIGATPVWRQRASAQRRTRRVTRSSRHRLTPRSTPFACARARPSPVSATSSRRFRR